MSMQPGRGVCLQEHKGLVLHAESALHKRLVMEKMG
jgi:hypothetical protein